MRFRNLAPAISIGLLLALLAGLAWLTRHPDSPWLERASRWPGVGPLAARFRAAYLPPAPSAPRPLPAKSVLVGPERRLRPDFAPLPAPAAEAVESPLEEAWLSPGTALAAERDGTGSFDLPGYANVSIYERRQGQARVRYRGRMYWVRESDLATTGEPPLGRAVEPPRPLPPRAADAGRLALARRLLGSAGRSGELGPYRLWTDLEDERLLARLALVAGRLDAAFAARTGCAPRGRPAETVVLFAREAPYRRFLARESDLAGLPASGHAGFGMVASYREGRELDEVEATLVHELTHLVSRRALGPALPAWLGEGLAEDLARAPRDAEGFFEFGGIGGEPERRGREVLFRGGWAALVNLAAALRENQAPSLADLLRFDAEEFRLPERDGLHYGQALFFVRFLFDSPGALAAPFRAYLAEVAAGGDPSGAALERHLGVDLAALEPRFRAWVLLKAEVGVGRLTGASSPSRRG